MMPPMGGQELQGVLGGVADGLDLSKSPLCELFKNCTRGSLLSAVFLACYKLNHSGQDPVVE